MQKIPVYLFLLCFTCPGLSQSPISGYLLDSETAEPLAFATIYVNGTTTGAVSREDGFFELPVEHYPADVIVSHVGYVSLVQTLNAPPRDTLYMYLTMHPFELGEVNVVDQNQRKKNLAEFRKAFLGTGTFGQKATILNEDVLFFQRDYQQRKLPPGISLTGQATEKSDVDSDLKKAVNLQARSRAPLQIEQPATGYTIQVDLIQFVNQYGSSSSTSWLGFYYFIPWEDQGKGRPRRFLRKRKQAYYNSSQHFLSALYQRRLAEEGYQVFERRRNEQNGQIDYVAFDLYAQVVRIDEQTSAVEGLAGKTLEILFYGKANGTPRPIKKRPKGQPVPSAVQFIEPYCQFRANGTIPDTNIRFGGAISDKKVGAMLPDNYAPNEDEEVEESDNAY